ncbi:hypothetical protein RFI_16498 [Reticulomyxa filosa]|uniref:Uncharacterized protein n=1 Tax=Reticulomyxa filosa TaxID=46433 RepID=X6N483_RETFI|nr:hypothetical protein RFI_16498 [Reticulomyxa filosa]|eukprot:ETO20723.1 hypothetical protein RFI_16498 [Reticulomyxa filosa]
MGCGSIFFFWVDFIKYYSSFYENIETDIYLFYLFQGIFSTSFRKSQIDVRYTCSFGMPNPFGKKSDIFKIFIVNWSQMVILSQLQNPKNLITNIIKTNKVCNTLSYQQYLFINQNKKKDCSLNSFMRNSEFFCTLTKFSFRFVTLGFAPIEKKNKVFDSKKERQKKKKK